MEPQTSCRNIFELAHAVSEDANLQEHKRYTARPWNRFEPSDKLWWLVPSTEWPAYRYGKAVLQPTQWDSRQVLCGLHVEKGFDPVVGTVYRALMQRGHILDETWIWQEFMRDLSIGRVEEVAQGIGTDTGFPVICEIDVWYSTDPTDFEPHRVPDEDASPDPCQRPGTAGYLFFELTPGAFHKIDAVCLTDLARPLAAVPRLADLSTAFSGSQLKWTWVDFYIGTVVSLAPRDRKTPLTEWDSQIWPRLMRPWSPWIK